MSFELAAVIVVAVLAVALGLICYHLLGRLEMLERAVHGGMEPPSTRLSREQFERRFAVAYARSEFAASRDSGLILVVGSEHEPQNELARTIEHLPRKDLITILDADNVNRDELGITTTPYLLVIDNHRMRGARPIASPPELLAALKELT